MSESAVKPRLTVDEYLAMEEAAEYKSEFFRGEMFAMAGGSEPHALIAANLTGALWSRLRGGHCRAYSSDLRVQVPAVGLYTYPDVTVVCGQAQFAPDGHQNLINPHLIVEVCSPSTANYDRGDKFICFQASPTLQDYLLVQQDRALIEHFHRAEGASNNVWQYKSTGHPVDSETGRQSILALPSLGLEIPLSEIYSGVDLIPHFPLPAGPGPIGEFPPRPSFSPKT